MRELPEADPGDPSDGDGADAGRWSLRERGLACVTSGWVWLAVGTEALGAMHRLTRPAVLAWWSLGIALGLLLLRPWRARARFRWPRVPGAFGWAVLALLSVLLLASLLQALVYPPNNVDSLRYHLPRQVYWAQAATTEHFPTNDLRQLTMPPLAEYAGLHLLLLTGGDHWHNLVQWSALLCTALAVSSVVRELGGSAASQLVAAALLVTAPPALAEASNTKNDLVVALFLTTAVLWTLRLRRASAAGRCPTRLVLLLGFSLACLVLTKGTGLVLGAPLALVAVRPLLRCGWRAPALVAALVIGLNAPHVARNLRGFGSLYGPEAPAHGERLSNEELSASALASNLSRNLARQLALPSPEWNRALESGVDLLHAALGRSPDDPRTTYRRPPWSHVGYSADHEDAVTAPVQVLMALLVPLMLVAAGERCDVRAVLRLWAVVAVGFLLFSAALKWQYWHARLLVPLLALAAPAIALAAAAVSKRLPALVLVASTATAWPVLGLVQRPLLGPGAWRLAHPDGDAPAGLSAAAAALVRRASSAAQPRVVGLLDDDYAVMRLVSATLAYRPRFTSFNARFNPGRLVEPEPDLVLGSRPLPDRLVHQPGGRAYVVVARAGLMAAYVPEAEAPGLKQRLGS